MRIILAAAVAVSVFMIAQASAQNTGAPAPSKSSPPKAAVGNAPVGHRQPTQAEIGKQETLAPSAEDKELDRKIRNICKGC